MKRGLFFSRKSQQVAQNLFCRGKLAEFKQSESLQIQAFKISGNIAGAFVDFCRLPGKQGCRGKVFFAIGRPSPQLLSKSVSGIFAVQGCGGVQIDFTAAKSFFRICIRASWLLMSPGCGRPLGLQVDFKCFLKIFFGFRKSFLQNKQHAEIAESFGFARYVSDFAEYFQRGLKHKLSDVFYAGNTVNGSHQQITLRFLINGLAPVKNCYCQ